MKRNIFRLCIAALTLTSGLASCDDGGSGTVVVKDESILALSGQSFVSIPMLDEKYELNVLKDGKLATQATLADSKAVLDEYNALNATEYEALSSSLYTISAAMFSFTESEMSKPLTITWDAADINDLDYNKKYAIAIKLSTGDADSEVKAGRDYLIVHVSTSPTSYVSVGARTAATVNPNAAGRTDTYEGSIKMDNPFPLENVKIDFIVDNDMVGVYNKISGTNYAAAPEGFFSLPVTSVNIVKNELSATFNYKINSSALFTGNKLTGYNANGYLIPVRITTTSHDAVGISDNNVMYIPVTMKKEIKGPWTVLEGQNNCYAMQGGSLATGWWKMYLTQRLFDGDPSTEWISWWFDSGENPGLEKDNEFPMVFVVDMGETHVFTQFMIADLKNHHSNYRKFEIYTAEAYTNETTVWNLVADGSVIPAGNTTYNFPPEGGTVNMIAGRYLKFVIVEPVLTTGDCIWGRGKLSEVYGWGF